MKEKGNRVNVHLELQTRYSGNTTATWDINPPSLDGIVPETGRCSIQVAHTITDLESRRAMAAALENTKEQAADHDEPIINSEQLKLARMHPDLLYRETPASQKGTFTPVEQIPGEEQEEEAQEGDQGDTQTDQQESGTEKFLEGLMPPPDSDADAGSKTGSEADTMETDDDDWQPDYPPVYEDEQSEKQRKAEQHATAVRTDDDENWANDYPPDYDSYPDSQPSHYTALPRQTAEERRSSSPAAMEEERSWYSYLWPFGGKEKKKELPAPVSHDRLPYPIPRDLEGEEVNAAKAGHTQGTMASIPVSSASLMYGPASAAPPGGPAATAVSEPSPQATDTAHAGQVTDEDIRQLRQMRMESGKNNADTPHEPAAHPPPVAESMNTDSEPPAAEGQNPGPDKAVSAENNEETVTDQAQAAPETVATAAVSQPSASRRKGGWFSWMWPESWRGGTGAEPDSKATAREPSGREDTSAGSYHSIDEPSPAQQQKRKPAWVWN